jgi:hypothetical protein
VGGFGLGSAEVSSGELGVENWWISWLWLEVLELKSRRQICQASDWLELIVSRCGPMLAPNEP